MKKFLTLFYSLALIFTSLQVTGQEVTEIIDAYFETIGGRENIAEIKSMKATCSAKVQGMEMPVTMYNSAPNKQRVDISLQGKTITQMCFDGSKGWGTNFMTMEAEAWDQEQTDITKAQMKLFVKTTKTRCRLRVSINFAANGPSGIDKIDTKTWSI